MLTGLLADAAFGSRVETAGRDLSGLVHVLDVMEKNP